MMTREEDIAVDNLFKMRGISRSGKLDYTTLKSCFRILRIAEYNIADSLESIIKISKDADGNTDVFKKTLELTNFKELRVHLACKCGRMIHGNMVWGGVQHSLDEWVAKYGQLCDHCLYQELNKDRSDSQRKKHNTKRGLTWTK